VAPARPIAEYFSFKHPPGPKRSHNLVTQSLKKWTRETFLLITQIKIRRNSQQCHAQLDRALLSDGKGQMFESSLVREVVR